MVRAKFVCQEKAEKFGGKGGTNGMSVVLTPVYDSNPESENGQFYRYTPSGRIELSILNQNAADKFEVGKEYYIDFTPAEGE